MGIIIVDEVAQREPGLLVPHKQPIGNVKLDVTHPLVNKAEYAFLFFEGVNPPVNKIDDTRLVTSSPGTGLYDRKIVNKKRCIARVDADVAGQVYNTPALGRGTSTRPFYLVMSFAPMASLTNGGIFSIGATGTTLTPEILIKCSATDTYTVYTDAGYRYTAISIPKYDWALLGLTFDGSVWSFFCTHKAEGSYTGDSAQYNSTSEAWIGSSTGGQFPTAFDYVIFGNWCPPKAAMRSWLKDPYQFLIAA